MTTGGKPVRRLVVVAVAWIGLGLALAMATGPASQPLAGQDEPPSCYEDAKERHKACIEDADGAVDRFRCDLAAMGRLVTCLIEPS